MMWAHLSASHILIRFIYVMFSGTPPFARPISASMAAHTAHLNVGEMDIWGKKTILVSDPYLLPLAFFKSISIGLTVASNQSS